MSEPWGIVVVPTEAGTALLAAGPYGARPPSARLCASGGVDLGRRAAKGAVFALPLWWRNALVPEGWDRARRVWSESGTAATTMAEVDPNWVLVDRAADDSWPEVSRVLTLARALESAGLCRVVVLDLVDGAVRERAP